MGFLIHTKNKTFVRDKEMIDYLQLGFNKFWGVIVMSERKVVRFTTTCEINPITTKIVSLKPVHGEVYLIQHYAIKFVSDLWQVGGFLQFPPPIKLTATI